MPGGRDPQPIAWDMRTRGRSFTIAAELTLTGSVGRAFMGFTGPVPAEYSSEERTRRGTITQGRVRSRPHCPHRGHVGLPAHARHRCQLAPPLARRQPTDAGPLVAGTAVKARPLHGLGVHAAARSCTQAAISQPASKVLLSTHRLATGIDLRHWGDTRDPHTRVTERRGTGTEQNTATPGNHANVISSGRIVPVWRTHRRIHHLRLSSCCRPTGPFAQIGSLVDRGWCHGRPCP